MNNAPSAKNLEIVDNQYPDREYEVKISIPEFTCVCPRTGQPDYALIEITYTPDKHIVELKSLKLYIQQYRNMGIFHEAVTNRILDDFREASNPRRIQVLGKFNARGGITTDVRASWPE